MLAGGYLDLELMTSYYEVFVTQEMKDEPNGADDCSWYGGDGVSGLREVTRTPLGTVHGRTGSPVPGEELCGESMIGLAMRSRSATAGKTIYSHGGWRHRENRETCSEPADSLETMSRGTHGGNWLWGFGAWDTWWSGWERYCTEYRENYQMGMEENDRYGNT